MKFSLFCLELILKQFVYLFISLFCFHLILKVWYQFVLGLIWINTVVSVFFTDLEVSERVTYEAK